MSAPRPNPRRSAALLLAAALLVMPAAIRPAAPAVVPATDLSQLQDVDATGLNDAQKKIALRVMNSNPCNCGCNMTIAECRQRDVSCRRSMIFARTILDALREGKPEAEVVRVLKEKTATFVEAKMPDDAGVVYSIDTTHNPSRGPKDARVTIVEFSDFQCPYCAGLQATLDQVLKAFPKDVRLVYKQYPLNIHQYARQAAIASLAAHAQGKFWELHDRLFQNFSAINEENIRKWAGEAGLRLPEFDRALQTGQYEGLVQKDMADGQAAKVLGTPTLFINGRKIHDRTFEGFKARIQEELAAPRGAASGGAARPATSSRPD